MYGFKGEHGGNRYPRNLLSGGILQCSREQGTQKKARSLKRRNSTTYYREKLASEETDKLILSSLNGRSAVVKLPHQTRIKQQWWFAMGEQMGCAFRKQAAMGNFGFLMEIRTCHQDKILNSNFVTQ